MVILAIDTSISSSGFCIMNEKKELLKYGKVTTDKKKFKSEHDRMNYIANVFENMIEKYNINEVIMEDAFVGKNAKGGLALKRLQGYLGRTFKELDHVSTVTVAAWRKALLHSTKKVDKEDVVEYVRENIIDLGELKSSTKSKNEDTYESIGICIAYLNDRENMIKKSLY